MTGTEAPVDDYRLLRVALSQLSPSAAHQANDPPQPDDIFAPRSHANALDPQRALVIGNRGVGKSFWSSVLTHDDARERVAKAYPRLKLRSIHAKLGFHEAAGKDDGPAPSPAVLSQLHAQHFEPETIWRGVLLAALRNEINESLPSSLGEILHWMSADVERAERALRRADGHFHGRGETFLLVFDALDRLGNTWDEITPLTKGILRFALDMRGYRAMKAKIFMRTDQSKDGTLFRFADASKIRSEEVTLDWGRGELFGLLYNTLLKDISARDALRRLAGEAASDAFLDNLAESAEAQQKLFYRLAGEYMGVGAKQGRTYSWLYAHLADTFGETSPRSFIAAMARAADFQPAPTGSVIDYNGIRAGVQWASRVRVEQLKEDYDWIATVLDALQGLEVPCEPSVFIGRWKDRQIVPHLREQAALGDALRLPLELAIRPGAGEDALLDALKYIGVIEFRTPDRINMPDIFRVAAGIKRRGGVRPPASRNA